MASHDKPEEVSKALESALVAYKDAWYAGDRIDHEAFCREHTECGEGLKEAILDFLFVVEQLPYAHRGDKGDAAAGRVLGDFRILREIGRGGMGTVYEAEQISLGRKVALKILPAHLSFSKAAVLKFRREAEAGGRQSHQGIVSIFAVGENKGVHYITQEFVEGGRTLADWLDELSKEQVPPKGHYRKAAHLFKDVSNALQHAHDAGVVHRDVKPTNILLSPGGIPKVTDFGLAKVEDALSLSRTGDFSGTPFYMSPEQISRRRIKLDYRTDIYSLGVTLYEVLTLRRPFEGITSHDVFKKIMAQEPQDPRRVNSQVPRDMAVICLKAMEKEPTNRYQSMAELERDLSRFLSGDVVLATPASVQVRIRKWVKQHAFACTVIGMALLFILGFLGYLLLWSYPKIIIERDKAITAQMLAEKEATTTKTVLDFLVDLFEASDPDNSPVNEIKVRDILDMGVEQIQHQFKNQPIIKARLLSTMGKVYHSLGLLPNAEKLNEQALELRRSCMEDDNPAVLSSMFDLAFVLANRGRFEASEEILLEVLSERRRVLGSDHRDTLETMDHLGKLYEEWEKYDKAEPLAIEAVDGLRRISGNESKETLSAIQHLGRVYYNLRRFDEAELLFREALEGFRRTLGDNNHHTFSSLNSMAMIYEEQGCYEKAESIYIELVNGYHESHGVENVQAYAIKLNLADLYYRHMQRYGEAESLYIDILEKFRSILGNNHPKTLRVIKRLASLKSSQGRSDEAEMLYQEAIEGYRIYLGDDKPSMLSAKHDLAVHYANCGRYEEADSLLREVVDKRRQILGDDHPDTIKTLNSLAVLAARMGCFSEAETYYREGLEISRCNFGDNHPDTLMFMANLAYLYFRLGRYEEAEPLLGKALENRRIQLGDGHPATVSSKSQMADLYANKGRFDEAEVLYIEVIEGNRSLYGENDPRVFSATRNLGAGYLQQDRYEEAEPLLINSLTNRREVLGNDHSDTIQSVNDVITLYMDLGEYKKAEPLCNEVVDFKRRVFGEDHLETLQAMSTLAALNMCLRRYNKVEPILLKLLGKERNTLGNNHKDTLSTIHNLVYLYIMQGRYEEAEPLARQLVEKSSKSSRYYNTRVEMLKKINQNINSATPVSTDSKID